MGVPVCQPGTEDGTAGMSTLSEIGAYLSLVVGSIIVVLIMTRKTK
jgi:hypothetical protein